MLVVRVFNLVSCRYILANPPATGKFSLLQIAKHLKEEFPSYPVSTFQMPVWMLRLMGMIDSRVTPELLNDSTRVR
jgi:hypothetical protein